MDVEMELLKQRVQALENDMEELMRMLKELKEDMDSRFEEHEDDYVHEEKPIDHA